MRLAFSGKARLPEFNDAYELYVSRAKSRDCMDEPMFRRVIKSYCRMLANQLEESGMVDLPMSIGSVCAAEINRKPQYRGKTFVGYGKIDWKRKCYDGSPRAFGIVFLPNRDKAHNLRSYGFVANRKLYKRIKEIYESYDCPWVPLEFNDEMI